MIFASGLAAILLVVMPLDDDSMLHASLRLANCTAVDLPAAVDGAAEPGLVARIYRYRGGAPLWIDRPVAVTEIPALIDRFADAGSHGLDPEAYPLERMRNISHARGAATVCERVALDMVLTRTAVDYAADLAGLRLRRPLPADAAAPAAPAFDLAAFVVAVAEGAAPPAMTIEGAAPATADYSRLRGWLRRLRALEHSGGWPAVSAGPLLRPGDRDPRVPDLRARLQDSGNDALPNGADDLYGDRLVRAVRVAQGRFGLAGDGVVGPRTLAALNVPVERRLEQVEFSLERLRCLPRQLGDTHVRVDVLRGRLAVVEGDSVTLLLRAIVGRPERPTPMFSSRITSLEVNPTWNIPQSLAREDVLPKVVQDPTYLVERGIRVFSDWRPGAPELDPLGVEWSGIAPADLAYKLQQRPGPANPLGRVKFLFPNPFAVYIHDTPHTGRFDETERFFSSGCVRVEEPLRLAAALLGDRYEDLANLLDEGDTAALPLSRPVAVHLVYATAWSDEEGALCFRDDVYGFAAESSATEDVPEGGADLPGAHGSGVDVNETGARVVTDASGVSP